MTTPQDSRGREIRVGDRVNWRDQIYTIKAFGEPIGRCGTRAIEFEETLHVTDEIPDEIAVDLVYAAPRLRCPWCGDNCPRFGSDVCPMRPRQMPRPREDGHVEEMWQAPVVPKEPER